MSQRLICGFSHNYCKLYRQTCARLLDVKRIYFSDIDEIALLYDTKYVVGHEGGCTVCHYKLEHGKYLRMTFIGDKGIPFTTYRTDTVEHFDKYANNVGKWFEIYVKEEEK